MPGLLQLLLLLLAFAVAECEHAAAAGDAMEADSLLQRLGRVKQLKRVKRVINGQRFGVGEWPWLVHLRGTRKSGGWFGSKTTYYCGGVILSERWVLTAAHCFKQGSDNQLMEAKSWHVTSGDVDWPCSGFLEGIRHFWCRLTGQASCRCHLHNQDIIIHPKYNQSNYWDNDVAIMKVEDNILAKANTAPVDLATADLGIDWPGFGVQCVVKGWGCTSGGGTVVDKARAVSLPAYDNDQCASFYTSRLNPIDIQNRMCAFKSGSGICGGDSGGPLVCRRSDNTWLQVGIVSFAAASAPELSPAVFARVSTYRNWIDFVLRTF